MIPLQYRGSLFVVWPLRTGLLLCMIGIKEYKYKTTCVAHFVYIFIFCSEWKNVTAFNMSLIFSSVNFMTLSYIRDKCLCWPNDMFHNSTENDATFLFGVSDTPAVNPGKIQWILCVLYPSLMLKLLFRRHLPKQSYIRHPDFFRGLFLLTDLHWWKWGGQSKMFNAI